MHKIEEQQARKVIVHEFAKANGIAEAQVTDEMEIGEMIGCVSLISIKLGIPIIVNNRQTVLTVGKLINQVCI